MPHSLRVRLGGLRYKKIISDKDYDRLCKALDNEKVLDKIRAKIAKRTIEQGFYADEWSISYNELMKIIDKYDTKQKVRDE